MFDLMDRPLVWIVAKWDGLAPGERGGPATIVQHEVELFVELLESETEITSILFDPSLELVTALPARAAAVSRLASDWRGVVSAGQSVPFTPENVRRFVDARGAWEAFQLAYARAIRGKVETREGNSVASPANGQAGEASDAAKAA